MDTVEITVEVEDPKFFDALENPQAFFPILGDAAKNIMQSFLALAQQPAPESEANQPGRFSMRTHEPMGYYERGRGWWYPVLTHNRLGLGGSLPKIGLAARVPHTSADLSALKAEGIAGVAGYRLSPTSERMQEQWQAGVTQTSDEVTGELTNLASYSGYVKGTEETALNKARDWEPVIDTWNSSEMQAVVDAEIDAALNQFFNL